MFSSESEDDLMQKVLPVDDNEDDVDFSIPPTSGQEYLRRVMCVFTLFTASIEVKAWQVCFISKPVIVCVKTVVGSAGITSAVQFWLLMPFFGPKLQTPLTNLLITYQLTRVTIGVGHLGPHQYSEGFDISKVSNNPNLSPIHNPNMATGNAEYC
jgi:hypothetical protein